MNWGGLEYDFNLGVTTSTPDDPTQTQYFSLGSPHRTTLGTSLLTQKEIIKDVLDQQFFSYYEGRGERRKVRTAHY